MFFELFCTFTLLFLSCELSDQISIDFENINDTINRFDWNSFPLEMQRLLPIIMANTQQSVGFECFRGFICNRDTFKKVKIAFRK